MSEVKKVFGKVEIDASDLIHTTIEQDKFTVKVINSYELLVVFIRKMSKYKCASGGRCGTGKIGICDSCIANQIYEGIKGEVSDA